MKFKFGDFVKVISKGFYEGAKGVIISHMDGTQYRISLFSWSSEPNHALFYEDELTKE